MAQFNLDDTKFMKLAIRQAKLGLAKGNYPCGAVLVADNKIIGRTYNAKENRQDRISHAEERLYIKYSAVLKREKAAGTIVTMYTTLEPCLMCFGAAVMHRVDRIVAAAPDPYGNMSKLNGAELGEFYQQLPHLQYGLLFTQSFELIKQYLEAKDDAESRRLMELFTKLGSTL